MAKEKVEKIFTGTTEVKDELCSNPYYSKDHLTGVTSDKLLEYLQFSQILCDFYDNEMKANTGDYSDDNTSAFNAASAKFTKYLNFQRRIFDEIERRVNVLC